MSRHIIHTQKIRLELSGKLEAQSIQNRVRSIWKDDLAEQLEAILDELAPPGKLVRIESLHLNLGVIESGKFEELFKERLISRLKDALLTVQKTPSAVEIFNDANHLIRPADYNDQYASPVIEPFLFFLRHGRLPWYIEPADIRKWEESLSQIPNPAWDFFLSWYRRQLDLQPAIIQRLSFQFPDSFLNRLLTRSVHQWTPWWMDVYSDLYSVLTNLFKQNSVTARDTIWKTALSVILGGSHETETIPAQVQTILEKIIQSLSSDGTIRTESSLLRPGWDHEISNGLVRDAFLILLHQSETALSRNGLPATNLVNDRSEDLSYDPAKGSSKDIPASITAATTEDHLAVRNSGLIILHPFLKLFFKGLGLLHDHKFTNEQACQKAVLLLHFLATGLTEADEFELTLQKILCGLPPDKPVPRYLEISEQEIAECDHLLLSVMSHWPPLKNTSIAGLRTSFLQREGQLSLKEAGWFLQIEHKTIDILLDKMPWGFSMIKLPWMPFMLSVEWRSPF
jgi:contractile injection system tape measure protein